MGERCVEWLLIDPSELSSMAKSYGSFDCPEHHFFGTGVLLGWLGLLMQTWFRNPLAGPGVLESSGGTLGVVGSTFRHPIPSWLAAAIGCISVLMLIGLGAAILSPNNLVFGLMISYVVSALVTIFVWHLLKICNIRVLGHGDIC